MFLSEWHEFPSAPCFAGKKTWWQLASRCCWNRARPWHASELVSFLVGLGTYQRPGTFMVPNFSVINFYDFATASKFCIVSRNHMVTHFTQVQTPVDTCSWFNVSFITQKILSQWFQKNPVRNKSICSRVKLCFQNHVPIFCKTILLHCFNPLHNELNPICPLLALFGAHHILHVSR